jgi:single-strand DNA-binding protein
MSNFNIAKTFAAGNLGADPNIACTSSGAGVVNLSIGVTESWKDKNTGDWKEFTEWYRVVKYVADAEIARIRGTYKKGDVVYVEGKMRTRKWQDANGIDRYTTELIADVIKLVMSKQTTRAQPAQPTQQQSQPSQESFDNNLEGGYNPADPFADIDR